jgi:hypothetical protein
MKAITWNCNMDFIKKLKRILYYKSDLLIVPECEHSENFKDTFLQMLYD